MTQRRLGDAATKREADAVARQRREVKLRWESAVRAEEVEVDGWELDSGEGRPALAEMGEGGGLIC